MFLYTVSMMTDELCKNYHKPLAMLIANASANIYQLIVHAKCSTVRKHVFHDYIIFFDEINSRIDPIHTFFL